MGKRQRAELQFNELNIKLKEGDSRTLPCLYCCADEHIFCTNPDEVKLVCCCFNEHTSAVDEANIITATKERGGQVKGYDSVTDIESTGRKRAAILYPISEGMICEWAGLLIAGGGVKPIVGCIGNLAKNIHHGPNKSTLANRPENTHRICTFCHNRWHSKNDEYYGSRPTGSEPFIPLADFQWTEHDSETKATPEQTVQNELDWKLGKMKG